MLNKELMMTLTPTPIDEGPHILLTVGSYIDTNDGYYGVGEGYKGKLYGKVNRQPYWGFYDEVAQPHPFELYVWYSHGNSTPVMLYIVAPFGYSVNELTVNINGKTFTIESPGGPVDLDDYVDPFDLKNNVGKTLPVWFDPPPLGYL